MGRFAPRFPAAMVLAAALVAGCSVTTAGTPVRGGLVGTAPGMTAQPSPSPSAAGEPGPSAATSLAPPGSGAPLPGSPAETAPAPCAATAGWTAAEQSTGLTSHAPIRAISAAAGDCFDQVLIEIGPDADYPGYLVRYVETLTQDGSGAEVPLAGTATLLVVLDSPAYDPETGVGTLQIPDHDHVVDPVGLTVIRQVAFAGSFEGRTTFGIGVDRERPFTAVAGAGETTGGTLTIRIAHG